MKDDKYLISIFFLFEWMDIVNLIFFSTWENTIFFLARNKLKKKNLQNEYGRS